MGSKVSIKVFLNVFNTGTGLPMGPLGLINSRALPFHVRYYRPCWALTSPVCVFGVPADSNHMLSRLNETWAGSGFC